MPLLEAVEHAALRSGVPVDARIESGRTPVHALQRLWDAEHFDRIVIPRTRLHPQGPHLDAHARAERDRDSPAGCVAGRYLFGDRLGPAGISSAS